MKNKGVRQSSFVKQATILMAASLFVRLMGFFYRIPLTGLIGDNGNNYYGSAYYIYTGVINVTSVFMIATVSRFVSERIALKQYRNAHKFFRTAMIISCLLGAIGAIVLYFGAERIVSVVLNPPADEDGNNYALYAISHAVRAISPAVFVVSLLTVFRGYFQGMKTAVPTALSQVIEQIFKISFSLWLAYRFFDAAQFEYAPAGATAGTSVSVVAALFVIVLIYLMVVKALKKRVNEDTSDYSEKASTQIAAILRTAFPIVIGLSMYTIANLIDIRMANSRIMDSGAFSANEVNILVGQFSGKFNLLSTLPISLSMAISSMIIPEIASANAVNDKAAVRQKTNLAFRLSMILAMPSAVGLGVLADPIIAMIFPSYPEGGWLLRYGAASIVLVSIVHVATGVLQGGGHVRLPLIGLAIGVLAKLPINYFFMALPSINILGAIISVTACFFIAAVMNMIFLRRYTGALPDFINTFFKPAFAAVGMGFVCYFVYNLLSLFTSNFISTMSSIVIGFVSYMLLMLLIKGLGKRELEMLPIGRLRRWLRERL